MPSSDLKLLSSHEEPETEIVILVVDCVGVWSEDMPSSWVSDRKAGCFEFSIGERWGEKVPPEVAEGMRFNFHFLLGPLFPNRFLAFELAGRTGAEVISLFERERVSFSSVSTTQVDREGREIASGLQRGPFLPSWGLAASSGLSDPRVGLIEFTPLTPLALNPLDIRVWLNGESDLQETKSLVFIPSLELVCEELFEKAESILVKTCLFLLRVEGSEWTRGERTASDSPIAESLLE